LERKYTNRGKKQGGKCAKQNRKDEKKRKIVAEKVQYTQNRQTKTKRVHEE
jgi:hypothetical protein